MNPWIMSLVLLLGFGIFAWSASRRWRLMTVGGGPNRFDQVGKRIAGTLRYAFAQEKMRRYPLAGAAHMLIFSGFCVLLLRSIILWGRGFDSQFHLWFLGVGQPLGNVYSLLKDVFAVLVILGTCVFVYYRVIKKLRRMTLSTEALVILGIILTMMVSDILYDAANLIWMPGQTSQIGPYTGIQFHIWEPAGSLGAMAIESMGVSRSTLNCLRHAGFWTHAVLVLVFLNILPYSKHFHIITAIPNVYLRNLDPPGRLAPIEDLEGKVEREETLGVARIDQLGWKAALDLYTCTECGRCTDFCPAANTGKMLSPKQFTVDLRNNLYERQTEFITKEKSEHEPIDLVGPVINPDVLWACTTCRACEQECPVMISYVDKFVDLRRYLVQEKGEFPQDLATAFRGLENSGNPWGLPAQQRTEWMEGLEVPRFEDKPDAEWLLWVGCGPAFDEKARKTARAVAQLLTHAGVSFAVLGGEETCTGDPARRAGNEFLFQILAQSNVEVLAAYNVKKIIAICPHCFNTFKNEYPDFDGHYEVVHHTDLLAKLIREGRLKPTQAIDSNVVYHDSCYLGRYNEIYDAPREVLRSIPGLNVLEAKDTRDRGMCCGAGGAQFFKEEEEGDERVNIARTRQLTETGADKIASACPFCMRMLTDGLAAQDNEKVAQQDIAELLLESVGPAKTTENKA
ncbi:MAG: (Fe-S)-binding protein [Phycisphaerales bacterium]|nr:(Fe-S)-binding protein [Phycisphaerales bacterium]